MRRAGGGRAPQNPRTQHRVRAERRGRFAETLCVARLRLTGWRILARRWTAQRGSGLGEVDIIARRGNVVAFIEVKARMDLRSGMDAVTTMQRARISRAANVFVERSPECAGCEVRFDVMIVGGRIIPTVIEDAWRPGLP